MTSKYDARAIEVVTQYFDAFQSGAFDVLVRLFVPGALIRSSSSRYEPVAPKDFYQRVLAVTHDKTVTILSIAIDSERPATVVVNFSYRWVLTDGGKKDFPFAFDRFEIDTERMRISSLVINLGADVLAT